MKIIMLLMFVFCLSLVSAAHPLPGDLVDEDTGLMEGMGDWAYNVSQGTFWFFLLLGFQIVLFIATVRYDVTRAFGYAGIAGIFGSIILLIMEWISWVYGSILILVGAFALAAMVKAK